MIDGASTIGKHNMLMFTKRFLLKLLDTPLVVLFVILAVLFGLGATAAFHFHIMMTIPGTGVVFPGETLYGSGAVVCGAVAAGFWYDVL